MSLEIADIKSHPPQLGGFAPSSMQATKRRTIEITKRVPETPAIVHRNANTLFSRMASNSPMSLDATISRSRRTPFIPFPGTSSSRNFPRSRKINQTINSIEDSATKQLPLTMTSRTEAIYVIIRSQPRLPISKRSGNDIRNPDAYPGAISNTPENLDLLVVLSSRVRQYKTTAQIVSSNRSQCDP